MKTIVAGGRDYHLSKKDLEFLDSLNITELVSGGATGADRGGEDWAQSKNIPVRIFKADWSTHRRGAGPIRNRQMARYAEAVVLFPGGRGTDSMRREAMKEGLIIYEP